MSGWEFSERNPITNFLVGIDFSTPLSAETLKSFSALHPQVKKELPRKVEQPNFTFQLPQMMFLRPPGIVQPGLGGVSFDRIKDDGTVLVSLSANANTLNYMVQSYSRWAEFQPTAERLLEMLTRIALEPGGREVVAFRLSATNTFFDRSSSSNLLLDALLRKDSAYFAPDLVHKSGYVHNFFGFSIDTSDPIEGQYTQNINISTAQNSDQERVAVLAFNHRVLLKKAITHVSEVLNLDAGTGAFRTVTNHMHDQNNALLAGILTPEIIARIPGVDSHVG